MDLENHQIKFYQSDISQKWWFEVIEEKNNKYASAPSGGPLVQHALLAFLINYC